MNGCRPAGGLHRRRRSDRVPQHLAARTSALLRTGRFALSALAAALLVLAPVVSHAQESVVDPVPGAVSPACRTDAAPSDRDCPGAGGLVPQGTIPARRQRHVFPDARPGPRLALERLSGHPQHAPTTWMGAVFRVQRIQRRHRRAGQWTEHDDWRDQDPPAHGRHLVLDRRRPSQDELQPRGRVCVHERQGHDGAAIRDRGQHRHHGCVGGSAERGVHVRTDPAPRDHRVGRLRVHDADDHRHRQSAGSGAEPLQRDLPQRPRQCHRGNRGVDLLRTAARLSRAPACRCRSRRRHRSRSGTAGRGGTTRRRRRTRRARQPA